MKQQSFEGLLKELDDIVKKLESGDLPLEDSIKLYKDGMTISADLNDKLNKVEGEITILLSADGKVEEKPLNLEE